MEWEVTVLAFRDAGGGLITPMVRTFPSERHPECQACATRPCDPPWGRRCCGGAALLQEMQGEATAAAPRETGGVLVGFWALVLAPGTGAPQAVLTAVVGPGPAATHEPDTFTPDHAFRERELARLDCECSRQSQHLGDWHTYPQGAARLSPRDLATLGRIADKPAA